MSKKKQKCHEPSPILGNLAISGYIIPKKWDDLGLQQPPVMEPRWFRLATQLRRRSEDDTFERLKDSETSTKGITFRGSCLPLSSIVPVLVSLCWMVCPPFRWSCLLLSPIAPLLVPQTVYCQGFLYNAFLRRPPSAFPRFFSLVSLLVSFCWMASAFLRSCLPMSPLVFHCLPLFRIVSHCLPLSPIVSHCLATCVPVLDDVSSFPRSCLSLSPIVSPHVCLCWMVCPPFQDLVSIVSQLVSQLVSLLVSLCGGWSQFAFSPNCVLSGVT